MHALMPEDLLQVSTRVRIESLDAAINISAFMHVMTQRLRTFSDILCLASIASFEMGSLERQLDPAVTGVFIRTG